MPRILDYTQGGKRQALPFRAGLLILAISLVIMALPLLWGRWDANKYFVAFGGFFACVAISILVNTAWDRLRGRRP